MRGVVVWNQHCSHDGIPVLPLRPPGDLHDPFRRFVRPLECHSHLANHPPTHTDHDSVYCRRPLYVLKKRTQINR